ncbi:MAG: DUF4129 domain-containing protein [Deltaproteobacteria bacterium]|nr:DUF4129 domain-containing protein [Deltaproteobacteria bacterium]
MLYITIAGMEFCWLYGALLLVNERASGPSLAVPGLLGLYLIGFGLHRYLRRLGWGRLYIELLSLTAWMVCLLLLAGYPLYANLRLLDGFWVSDFFRETAPWKGFPSPQFLTLVCGGALWWCGRRVAAIRTDHEIILSEFQFGIALLLILFFMDSQWSLQLPGLLPLTLAFFLFGLLGMSLAHARAGSGWFFSEHRAPWAGFVILSTCIVLAAGLLLSAMMRPDLLQLLVSLAKEAASFVGGLIVKLLSYLIGLFPPPEPYEVPLSGPPLAVDRDPSFVAKVLRIPESVRKVAGVFVASLWVILFTAALWSLSASILRWLRRRVVGMEGVELESLHGAFLHDLSALGRFILRRFATLWNLLLRILGRGRKAGTDPPEVVSVREVYRRLLRWGAKGGCPRNAAQTPREYLDVLIAWLPERRWEVAFITHQYVQARYSPLRPSRNAVERLNAVWTKLKSFRPGKSKNVE